MSITATRVRGSDQAPADHYTCARCGRVAKFCLSRGKPTLCRDCKDVEPSTTPTETRPS